eukprot:Clim_evm51s236 gene=Clim_evmTU51s236
MAEPERIAWDGNLTPNAIPLALGGSELQNPKVQVINVRAANNRYRLQVSDGENMCTCVVSTQVGTEYGPHLVAGQVICIENYVINQLDARDGSGKKFIVILSMNMCGEPAQIIGTPKQYNGNNENQNPSGVVIKSEPVKPESKMRTSPPPAAKPLGSNTGNGASRQNNVSTVPDFNAGSGDHSDVIPIKSLNPYHGNWKIRARVTNKSSIRHWQNERGEGKLFSVDLTDENGEIRATAFRDTVDLLYPQLEIDKVYIIQRGSVKIAQKKFNPLNNDYEITFDQKTIIQPVEDDVAIPHVGYQFVPINKLADTPKDHIVDLIGAVRAVGEVSSITTRATNRQVSKRDITLIDQTETMVQVTLWGSFAEEFNGSGNPILAIKGAKTSDFGGVSVSVLGTSVVQVNPDIPEAFALRTWYDGQGQSVAGTSLSGVTNNTVRDMYSETRKFFTQIKGERLGAEEVAYFVAKGTIMYVNRNNVMYKACPEEGCNKKVIDQGNGEYRCEKCDKFFSTFQCRWMISMNCGDATGSEWLMAFNSEAEKIFGMKADDVLPWVENEEQKHKLDELLQNSQCREYLFKIRAKAETYQDDTRTRLTVLDLQPIDYVRETKHLLAELNQDSMVH